MSFTSFALCTKKKRRKEKEVTTSNVYMNWLKLKMKIESLIFLIGNHDNFKTFSFTGKRKKTAACMHLFWVSQGLHYVQQQQNWQLVMFKWINWNLQQKLNHSFVLIQNNDNFKHEKNSCIPCRSVVGGISFVSRSAGTQEMSSVAENEKLHWFSRRNFICTFPVEDLKCRT